MSEKSISIDDIFKNPGDSDLIKAFNKQLQSDMSKVYEESAAIERMWNRKVKILADMPCKIIKIPQSIEDKVYGLHLK